ncbi:MAG: hypothetical protein J4F48_11050 [Nitrospinae bacterium]|nr:hypothetical protein [Nitrospinota bacterium]
MKSTHKLIAAFSIFILIVLQTLMLAGCGGGGGGGRVAVPAPAPMPEATPSYTSTNPPAPLFNFEVSNHIGTSAGAPTANLRSAGVKNGVQIYEGRIADGERTSNVITYMRQVISDAGYLTTFPNPPTVSVVEGTDDEFTTATVHAVRIVNSILPYDKQLIFGESYAPSPTNFRDVPYGNVYVEFIPQNRWPQGLASEPSTLGYAHSGINNNEAYSSHILIDTGEDLTERDFVHVIVHELLHALGFHGHSDARRFPLSILNAKYIGDLIPLLLTEIDKDAVLAAYTRFRPGTPENEITAVNLGPWESSSFHVRGEFDVAGGKVAFGASTSNGMTHPWARGPKPSGDLRNNRLLQGAATWEGALLGFTPSGQKITGNTRLDVHLTDLMGELQFLNLEYSNNSTWGDGGLEYSVHIEKNSFHNWGHESKDAGDVFGAFFGRNHEGMGGVLRRQDLTGAFGGRR